MSKFACVELAVKRPLHHCTCPASALQFYNTVRERVKREVFKGGEAQGAHRVGSEGAALAVSSQLPGTGAGLAGRRACLPACLPAFLVCIELVDAGVRARAKTGMCSTPEVFVHPKLKPGRPIQIVLHSCSCSIHLVLHSSLTGALASWCGWWLILSTACTTHTTCALSSR